MVRFRSVVLALCVALIATSAFAQDDKAKKKRKRQRVRQNPQVAATLRPLAQLDLSKEQKAKIETLAKEFSPKFAELNKKRQGIFTEEQVAKLKAARTKRGADRKTTDKKTAAGKRSRGGLRALDLTKEQQKQIKEVTAAQRNLVGAFREKVMAVLTAEQKEKLPKAKRANRKKGADKKAGAKKRKKTDQANPAKTDSAGK